MFASPKPLSDLTAADLMNRQVISIPVRYSLREAAEILQRNQIAGAPVVDEEGCCVGLLSAHHYTRWTCDGSQPMEIQGTDQCPFLVNGRLLTGETLAICILEEGACEFQRIQPSIGGLHTAVCSRKPLPLTGTRHCRQDLPQGSVARYMDTRFIIAQLDTPIGELTQLMLTAHVDRIVILDQQHRPVGIVSSFDLLSTFSSQFPCSGPVASAKTRTVALMP